MLLGLIINLILPKNFAPNNPEDFRPIAGTFSLRFPPNVSLSPLSNQ